MEDAQIGSLLMAQPFYMGLEKLLQNVPLRDSVITNFFLVKISNQTWFDRFESEMTLLTRGTTKLWDVMIG